MCNYRHPGPRRVWKGGPELHLMTPDPLDPLDPLDPVDPVDPLDSLDPLDPLDPGMNSRPMISCGRSSQNRPWEVRLGAHLETDP